MRADARANRQAIVDAAITLYAARGAAVSMNAIAQEAGVGIATLYRHFATPGDLVQGVAEHVLGQLTAICEGARSAMQADPEKGWRDFIDRLVALRLGALVPQLITLIDAQNVAAQFARFRSQLEAALTPVLDVAKAQGLLDPAIGALQFHVGLGSLTRPLPALADVHVPGELDWLVEVFVRGIRPEQRA